MGLGIAKLFANSSFQSSSIFPRTECLKIWIRNPIKRQAIAKSLNLDYPLAEAKENNKVREQSIQMTSTINPLIQTDNQSVLQQGIAKDKISVSAESFNTDSTIDATKPKVILVESLKEMKDCGLLMDGLKKGNDNDGKYEAAELLRKYAAAGRLGRKSGRGFYSYGRSDRR